MRSSRYLLTRTWDVPAGMGEAEAIGEAKAEFTAEIEALEDDGFKCLTGVTTTTHDGKVTCTTWMRGPAGQGWNEHEGQAAGHDHRPQSRTRRTHPRRSGAGLGQPVRGR